VSIFFRRLGVRGSGPLGVMSLWRAHGGQWAARLASCGGPIQRVSFVPWRRWMTTQPYLIASHTAFQKLSLKEALEECVSRLPAQPAQPSLIALVLSKSAYAEQLTAPETMAVLPPSPAIACLTDAIDDPLSRRLLGFPEDQNLIGVTLTALYLPPGSPCCPFHAPADAVPKFRGYNDEPLPLGKYLGKQGEPLTFMVLTQQRFEAVAGDPTFHLQHRLRNLFPNGEVTWLALHQCKFLVAGALRAEGASGVAIPSVDPNCAADFLLAAFSMVPTFLLTMSAELCLRLFLPSTNVTRPSGKIPSLHDTFWMGMYQFIVDDVQSYVPEVALVREVGSGISATKLTGDPYVPAGEVTWLTSKAPSEFSVAEPGQLQVADYEYTNPAFLQAQVTVCSPEVIEVGFVQPQPGIKEGHEAYLQKTLFTRLTWDEDRPSVAEDTVLPIFHAPGALVLPEGVVYFSVFELRYRRMLRRALEDGSLIGVVDLRATQAKGSEWVIGTACRVIYADFADNRHTPVLVRGVGRFHMKAGGGTLSDFGLASARCSPRDDLSVTDVEATEGWVLAEDIGRGLRYNPLANHLQTVPRTAATLSRVSFALATQILDERLFNPPKSLKAQAEALTAFVGQMSHLKCPLKRLKILAIEAPH